MGRGGGRSGGSGYDSWYADMRDDILRAVSRIIRRNFRASENYIPFGAVLRDKNTHRDNLDDRNDRLCVEGGVPDCDHRHWHTASNLNGRHDRHDRPSRRPLRCERVKPLGSLSTPA